MSHITFVRVRAPRGTVSLDTSRLLIGTDGRVFMRDSATGHPVQIADDELRALEKHFSRETVILARENVEQLA